MNRRLKFPLRCILHHRPPERDRCISQVGWASEASLLVGRVFFFGAQKIPRWWQLKHFSFSGLIWEWWGNIFIFIPTWGNDPIWLIFFKRVETTRYDFLEGFCFENGQKLDLLHSLKRPHDRWWFLFFNVQLYLGKWSNLTIAYFSYGLKPPTKKIQISSSFRFWIDIWFRYWNRGHEMWEKSCSVDATICMINLKRFVAPSKCILLGKVELSVVFSGPEAHWSNWPSGWF